MSKKQQIQELEARIKALEQRVADLESSTLRVSDVHTKMPNVTNPGYRFKWVKDPCPTDGPYPLWHTWCSDA